MTLVAVCLRAVQGGLVLGSGVGVVCDSWVVVCCVTLTKALPNPLSPLVFDTIINNTQTYVQNPLKCVPVGYIFDFVLHAPASALPTVGK